MTTRKIKASTPTFLLKKTRFGVTNKAYDWKDATWSWIVDRGYAPIDSVGANGYKDITLMPIEVHVWPEHHKPYDPNLNMIFDSDVDGLSEARKYARTAIASGAIMAEIRMSVNFPWKHNVLAQTELFTLDEPTPIDPRDL